jgi:hypothetical protein
MSYRLHLRTRRHPAHVRYNRSASDCRRQRIRAARSFVDPERSPPGGLRRRGVRVDAGSNWLWKKPSLTFFHEGERRKSRGFSPLAAAAASGG